MRRASTSSGGRQFLQRLGLVGLEAQLLHEGLGADGGVDRAHGGDVLAAHGRDLVVEARRARHGHQGDDLAAAARLAEGHDIARVAAEGGDVVAHPLQGQDQVHVADIAAVGQLGSAHRAR
jgi:hypothetical protein